MARTHLDGAGLARWLRKEGYATTATLGDAGMRRVHAWENEVTEPIERSGDAADRVLTKAGVYDWMIPEELWVDNPTCVDCGEPVVRRRRRGGARCDECRRRHELRMRSTRRKRQAEKRQAELRRLDGHPAMVGLERLDPRTWIREKEAA